MSQTALHLSIQHPIARFEVTWIKSGIGTAISASWDCRISGENPDVVIDRLYVEPMLGESHVSPDIPTEQWPRTSVCIDVVDSARSLVVLGDPGSGKSTLVNWISWQLARSGENPWSVRFQGLIPIPMTLRDLRIGRDVTWDGLVKAWMDHDMAAPLRGSDRLDRMLKSGQAFVFLDGLDEIGDLETRKALRSAFQTASMQFSRTRWLLTSRIVGYDEVPFDRLPVEESKQNLEEESAFAALSRIRKNLEASAYSMLRFAQTRYVAPFSDVQISEFARNWFTLRETSPSVANRNAGDLVEALVGNPGTLRLARVPNILTMMALIHRVRARLPHGRALLYSEICQAYLQSIDEFRGIREGSDYELPQKKRWLARIAFEMQRHRSKASASGDQSEILADQKSVQAWIGEAMAESGLGRDESTAAAFVNYIGRRSGLLLPRGPAQFAFMHLSLQEYFAASFLAEQIVSPQWIVSGEGPPGADRKSVIAYAKDPLWTETLIFLFEILADQKGWPEALSATLFGKSFALVKFQKKHGTTIAELAARIAIDPHAGLPQTLRKAAICKCWDVDFKVQDGTVGEYWQYKSNIARVLFSAEEDLMPYVLESMRDTVLGQQRDTLVLTGCAGLRDLAHICGLKLKTLNVAGAAVDDLSPLVSERQLEALIVDGTRVRDLGPIRGLSKLEEFSASECDIVDFSPIRGWLNLTSLDLTSTPLKDVAELGTLRDLRYLSLRGTDVADITLLKNISSILELDISGTSVRNLAPLGGLDKLRFLVVRKTEIEDLQGLANCHELTYLDMSSTRVTSLRPLHGLHNLSRLLIYSTGIPQSEIEMLKRALPELRVIAL